MNYTEHHLLVDNDDNKICGDCVHCFMYEFSSYEKYLACDKYPNWPSIEQREGICEHFKDSFEK